MCEGVGLRVCVREAPSPKGRGCNYVSQSLTRYVGVWAHVQLRVPERIPEPIPTGLSRRAYPDGPIPTGLSRRAYPDEPIPTGLSRRAYPDGPIPTGLSQKTHTWPTPALHLSYTLPCANILFCYQLRCTALRSTAADFLCCALCRLLFHNCTHCSCSPW